MSSIEERNRKIGEARKSTRLRRLSQTCKTFKFKIPTNRLSTSEKEHLKMMFVEAKWIYNYLLSKSNEIDIFDIAGNYKSLNKVSHFDKDKNLIESDITHILSSVKQELMQQIANQIKGLSVLKSKGKNVGKLRYKSDFNSIKFKQYGVTHYIKGNKIKIQGIKKLIPLLGIKQLNKYDNIEFTTMNLIKEVDDYYVCLTCFFDKTKTKQNNKYKNDITGIDLGISTNLTLSNGEKINCYVEESERTKMLQAKIARSKKGSNNRYKLIKKLAHSYIKTNNKKNDLANKIVCKLLKENHLIVIQDDNLNNMKDGNKNTDRSDIIQHSILGRVKYKLKQRKDRVVWLDKWWPTTQYCNKCGEKTKLSLNERTFKCENCGYTDDRDIHAATNMIYFFLECAKLEKDIYTGQELASGLSMLRYNHFKDKLSVQ